MAQLVASMSGVVLGGVVEVVGSNLARGKIFTASIGSVDSLYPPVFIYCLNLHHRPVILANIWVKPTTYCYRNEKCIFEIYNPICISEKKSSNVA